MTSQQRHPTFADVPTLQEADVDVMYVNWRGIVAPPGLDRDDIQALQDAMTELRASSEWRDAFTRNGWTDAFLAGNEFSEYIRDETPSCTLYSPTSV